MGQRRAFSVSIYCRNEGSVLLILHKRLGVWVPIGGELAAGETPLEAAFREIAEETGHQEPHFPIIHNVLGAPPGLLLYEEHAAGDKGLHMNFVFLVELASKQLKPCSEYTGSMWISSADEVPLNTPANVQQALPFALTAGHRP